MLISHRRPLFGFPGSCFYVEMTYEEALQTIPCGRYRHFKGNEYEVIAIARNSETQEPIVVYKALYGDDGIWVRPADMWNETIERDGKKYKRFERVTEETFHV